MASFLDNENEMITGALIQEVSDQLFEDWCNANLDESDIYADYRLLELAGDNYLYNRFNEFYSLKPGDEYYIEVE